MIPHNYFSVYANSAYTSISYPHMVVSELSLLVLLNSGRLCCEKAISYEKNKKAICSRCESCWPTERSQRFHIQSTFIHIQQINQIILDLASLSSVQAFMEEDQQDSGGEYDLQEGFDRLMIFCGENQTESLEFCKLHCEFTGWFSYVFLPIFSTNMKNQLQ